MLRLFAFETKSVKFVLKTHSPVHFFLTYSLFTFSVRMTLACLLNATGLIVVATANSEWQAILGIIVTSFSSGLGETSMLAYTSKFNR